MPPLVTALALIALCLATMNGKAKTACWTVAVMVTLLVSFYL